MAAATRTPQNTDLMLDDLVEPPEWSVPWSSKSQQQQQPQISPVRIVEAPPRSNSPPRYPPPDIIVDSQTRDGCQLTYSDPAADARSNTTFEMAKLFAQKTLVSDYAARLTLNLRPGCDPLTELGRVLVAELKMIPQAPASGDVAVIRDVSMDSLQRMSRRLKQIMQVTGPISLEFAVGPGRDPICELFRAAARKAVPLVPIEWERGDAATVTYHKLVDIASPAATPPPSPKLPSLTVAARVELMQQPQTSKRPPEPASAAVGISRPARRSRGKEPDADLLPLVDYIRLSGFSEFLPAALKMIRGIGYACAFVDVFGTLVVPEARAYAMLDAHLEPMERVEQEEMDCQLRDEDYDRAWAAEKKMRRAKIMERIPKSNGYAMTREDAVEVMGLLADATEGRLYYITQAEFGVPMTTTMLVEMGFPLVERHVMPIDEDRTKGLQVRAILNKGAPGVIATAGMHVFVIDDSELALKTYRDPEAFGDKILICALFAP